VPKEVSGTHVPAVVTHVDRQNPVERLGHLQRADGVVGFELREAFRRDTSGVGSPVSRAPRREACSSTTLIDAASKYGAFEKISGPSSMS